MTVTGGCLCGAVRYRSSAAETRPELIIARAGTLDDRELVAPAGTIWTVSAPSWACIAEHLPKFDAQPPPL